MMTNVLSGGAVTIQMSGWSVNTMPALLRSVSPLSGEGTNPLPWPIVGGPNQVMYEAIPSTITVFVIAPANISNSGNRTVTVAIPIINESNLAAIYTYQYINVQPGGLANSPTAAGPAPNYCLSSPS